MEQVNRNKGKLVARPGIEPKTPVFLFLCFLIYQPRFISSVPRDQTTTMYQKVSFWEWLKQD